MADITPDIRRVFESELAGISSLPPIAWENIAFDPETSEGYLEPQLFPSRREPATRGTSFKTFYQGYYLVRVYSPSGVGPSQADNYASTIIEHFEATSDISQAGTTVSIRYAERDSGVKDGAFYYVPVRIGYYIYN